MEAATRNHSRGFRDLAFFEAGLVFLPGEQIGTEAIPPLGVKPCEEVLEALYAGVPDQPLHVGAVLTGHEHACCAGSSPRAWEWADAVDVARAIVGDVLGVELVVTQGGHQAFHPGRARAALAAHRRSGGLRRRAAPEAAGGPRHAGPFRGPGTERRGSVRGRRGCDRGQAHLHVPGVHPGRGPGGGLRTFRRAEVLAALREGAGELLEDVALFDVYSGSGIEPGKKSLAFSLRFRADDRTLTADEASARAKVPLPPPTNASGLSSANNGTSANEKGAGHGSHLVVRASPPFRVPGLLLGT